MPNIEVGQANGLLEGLDPEQSAASTRPLVSRVTQIVAAEIQASSTYPTIAATRA